MHASTVLTQLLALAGLIGAVGAYAGILRRRRYARAIAQAAAESSSTALERVGRLRTLGHIARDKNAAGR